MSGTTSQPNFRVINITANAPPTDLPGTPYAGQGQTFAGGLPLTGVQNEFVSSSMLADSLLVIALTPNVFIATGSGNDGIVAAQGGSNVIDPGGGVNVVQLGSTGSDLLVFDANLATPTGDAFLNFHAGDGLVIRGASVASQTTFADDTTVLGSQALELTTQLTPGGPVSKAYLPGYSVADLANGRLSVSFTTPPAGNADTTPNMLIHANA
jgi:hypothetical protein